ncbi:hypothetical protein EMCG_07079 [[Emmonsia] crescens]|uniref:Rhodopsin domain-containing protein n=1 Tax=[Emmonsia] crescens TaxID=73230 RepID=A0A0G2J616_9EURO|nr:hypothetical protein EMCG_07079 [Emmonsia crescens UAMH 3008]
MSAVKGALDPPPGLIPNFEHPKDNLNTVLVVTQILCIIFVTIFFSLRVYVKLSILRSFGREDWTCVISWILCLGYCGTAIFMAKSGAGYDQWEITEETLVGFMKSGYAATIFYMPMAFFVKLALLLIIARVFSPYKRTVIFIYVFLGILFAYYVSGLVIKARPCSPVSAYWGASEGSCLDQRAIIICDSVISVVSDLIILVLPLPLAWSLHLDTKKKLRIMAILGAGGLATAFSIYRLVMIVITGASPNQVMVFTRVVLSGNAEIGIGLICACLPALNALVGRKRQELSSRRQGETGPCDYQLSKVDGNAKSLKIATQLTPEADSDKDYLISHSHGRAFEIAVINDANSATHSTVDPNGILKTVDVSHSYEAK